jgi:hypothetical protein
MLSVVYTDLSLMLSVTQKLLILNVIMLNVIMMSVVAPRYSHRQQIELYDMPPSYQGQSFPPT